jgi:hypothetical protein
MKVISKSTEQNSCPEADGHFTAQELPCALWKPEVHFRAHNWPPLVTVPSQTNSGHIFPAQLIKIHHPENYKKNK